MASKIENRQINVFIETGQAQRAYDKLAEKQRKLQAEMDKVTDPRRQQELRKELDKLSEPLDRAGKKLRGELNPSFKELTKTVSDLRKEVNHLDVGTGEWVKKARQLKVAEEQVARYKQQVKEVAQAQKEVSGSSMFKGAFLGTLAARGIERALEVGKQMIGQSVRWALEVEGVKRAYDRLNRPELLDELRRATRGTVSDLELMKKAVQANNFQIPLETLGKLLAFAQQRARETGENVDYLVNSIVTGIARKSPLILDNLGINITRINEEFKKTGDFAKAAFNVVEEEMKSMGPVIDTSIDKVDRLKAGWQNMWTIVGEGVVSGYDIAVKVFEATVGAFESGTERMQKAQERGNQRRAAETQRAYEFELRMIRDFGERFANANADGQKKIISQVEREISITKQLRQEAFDKGYQDQVRQFDRYLDAWGNFLNKLRLKAAGTDTLAGIDTELQQLQEQLRNTLINDPKFKQLQKQIKDLEKKRDDATGRTADEASRKLEAAGRKAESERQAANRRVVDDQKRLAKELLKLRTDLLAATEGEMAREIRATTAHFEELRQLAHGNADLLKKIKEAEGEAIMQIQFKYNRQATEEHIKALEKREKMIAAAMERFVANTGRLGGVRTEVSDMVRRNADAGKELQLLQARGKERLKLELNNLEEERKQKLANKNLTENEILLIEEQFRLKRKDAEDEFNMERWQQWLDYARQVISILDSIGQAKTERENQELERDRKLNDTKKKNMERQLKAGLLSRAEYDKKIAELDKQQEQKEKEIRIRQFRREQRAGIASTLMNAAEAGIKLWAKPGWPNNIPLLVLLAGQTLAAIDAISSRKPEFARGGRTSGRSHAQGGMAVVDHWGRKQAEIEGNEGIINRRSMGDRRHYTVTGTPSQIASSINALHGGVHWEGGATLVPVWRSSPAPRLNYAAIQRRFEDGGVMQTQQAGASQQQDVAQELITTVQLLRTELSRGIIAYTSLQDHNRQQRRLSAIRNDATMRG